MSFSKSSFQLPVGRGVEGLLSGMEGTCQPPIPTRGRLSLGKALQGLGYQGQFPSLPGLGLQKVSSSIVLLWKNVSFELMGLHIFEGLPILSSEDKNHLIVLRRL